MGPALLLARHRDVRRADVHRQAAGPRCHRRVDRQVQGPGRVTVKNGTHAWVVLGYRTSHDPIEPTKKTILGFYVSGPLGTAADKWPYAYLTASQFKSYFTRYHEWQRKVIWEGKWVIIAQ